ncbi:hypothetical protein SAMN05661091_0169 [Paenibacillus uliginis N3/975]|uniref:Uncharacterized protein n=1 Tax=Paenibacillus uliginis N3/975 TaxID=1313296 RepID=A0A1X7G7N9_9BACL|nr:DUF378 domain-containing protein [Paenibacillus uliginis]SMF65447.1 hypothetical protein SAMN05661091_0169 [Paenibacillus uliginis N3/975]
MSAGDVFFLNHPFGGINWLLVGLFQYDLVASIFGGRDSIGARVIYTIVGLCALYSIKFFRDVTEDDRTSVR